MLLLETGMLGVFMALDLFVFYIFWEVMLIPMALLIGVWGSTNRVYAAIKFFIYTLFGSLLMLVGIVATYQAYSDQTGERTLDILKLQQGWSSARTATSSSMCVRRLLHRLCGQGADVPVPHLAAGCPRRGADRRVGDPGGGHAEDGRLRLAPLQPAALPGGTEDWAAVIVILSVIAIIYGALVALVQPDMKKLIAYSSVSHMGFVTLGIFVPLLVLKADRAAGQVQGVENYLNGSTAR